jgi:hypothetical protein
MADVKPYLQKMVDRFADAGVQAAMKGFNKTLQFKFPDTNESWLLRAVDGTSATTAYMQRKIVVKGAMEDLMKLQKLML